MNTCLQAQRDTTSGFRWFNRTTSGVFPQGQFSFQNMDYIGHEETKYVRLLFHPRYLVFPETRIPFTICRRRKNKQIISQVH